MGHDKPPSNLALSECVLMMILWRQRVTIRRRHFMTATFAPIDTGVRRNSSGWMNLVKGYVLRLLKQVRVFV
jgi:hypothetical protein